MIWNLLAYNMISESKTIPCDYDVSLLLGVVISQHVQ
jgi:hypothetical protein